MKWKWAIGGVGACPSADLGEWNARRHHTSTDMRERRGGEERRKEEERRGKYEVHEKPFYRGHIDVRYRICLDFFNLTLQYSQRTTL